jgi:tRNA nucleotidyltransferase (CCA-adding enzyme)
LRPFSTTALHVLLVAEAEEEGVQEAVRLYLERLRFIRTVLNGDDLQALGLPPGPLYKELLGALLEARLEGRVHSRAEEEAFLKETGQERGLLAARPEEAGELPKRRRRKSHA